MSSKPNDSLSHFYPFNIPNPQRRHPGSARSESQCLLVETINDATTTSDECLVSISLTIDSSSFDLLFSRKIYVRFLINDQIHAFKSLLTAALSDRPHARERHDTRPTIAVRRPSALGYLHMVAGARNVETHCGQHCQCMPFPERPNLLLERKFLRFRRQLRSDILRSGRR
ncbi:hypothetical protein [Burkholderia ubonensis]|uniref:hypothetical protein n=1 Tax=Burkholderia ubonensis TaxID=101571 RepID=UPI0010550CEB|nr:hypothetical protein [Burkholderia ubonensis]